MAGRKRIKDRAPGEPIDVLRVYVRRGTKVELQAWLQELLATGAVREGTTTTELARDVLCAALRARARRADV